MFLLGSAEARACGRGVHYAIPAEWVEPIHPDRGHTPEQVGAFIDLLDGHFEGLRAAGWVQETDKAWHLIHRCLTGGSLDGGFTPGHLCVLGSTDYYWVERADGTAEWIVNLLDPSEVREAAGFVAGIDEAELRRRYDAIDPGACDYDPAEDDFEYAAGWFAPLRAFLIRAAEGGRWVAFVAGGPA
jgi:hypothetical protein